MPALDRLIRLESLPRTRSGGAAREADAHKAAGSNGSNRFHRPHPGPGGAGRRRFADHKRQTARRHRPGSAPRNRAPEVRPKPDEAGPNGGRWSLPKASMRSSPVKRSTTAMPGVPFNPCLRLRPGGDDRAFAPGALDPRPCPPLPSVRRSKTAHGYWFNPLGIEPHGGDGFRAGPWISASICDRRTVHDDNGNSPV